MNVTVFQQFNKIINQFHISEVLNQIRSGKYREQVTRLQDLLYGGKIDEYNQQKKSLLAFTPSATFEGGRKIEFLEEYSGLLILDIDKLQPDQLAKLKKLAKSVVFTYSVFTSPSGKGLKILVRIDSKQKDHLSAFNQVVKYYESELKISIDPSGKDITRLCFFSWDPELYLNPNSPIFPVSITNSNLPENPVKKQEPETTTPQDNMISDIESVISQIETNHLDITANYDNWVKICFSLIDVFGSNARDYFHRISRFYSGYDLAKCDKQFDQCLNHKSHGITIKTFFGLAKDHGVDISPVKSVPLKEENKKTDEKKEKEKDKEKPKKNLFDIIERHLLRSYFLRYNVVTDKLEIKRNGNFPYEPMTDYIENSIFRQLHKSSIYVSMAKLRSILQSDFCNRYDPFQEYFDNLPKWDETIDYIKQLASTITTNDDKLWHICFRKWIVAVVASLLDTKVVNHTAIIFSGAQGIGKTTWMEKLCPPELRDYLFSGTINPNNKDTLIHISECMLINMDELENMNRTEIGTLKEIITKSAIRIRRSYGHNNQSLIRRASFMGSVNTSQFLNDSTGSRRFLCFEVSEIEYNHNIDIQFVYAQALYLWKEGFRFYFDKDEVGHISENNEKYQIRTTEEELLLAWFLPVNLSEATCFLSASQIIAKLAEKARISISNGSLISLGKALRKHNFSKTKKGGVYVWAVKELTYDEVDSNSRDKPDDLPF